MLSPHNVTLLGSNLLFLVISAALFLRPGMEAAVYPAFLLVFLWGDLRKDEETHVIFLFLAAAAAAVLIARSQAPAVRWGLGLEALGLCAASLGLDSKRGRLIEARRACYSAGENLDLKLRDAERELRFYGSYEGSASAQLRLRRDLAQSAKALASTMDPREVQLRLLSALEGRYPGSRVKIVPGAPEDPLIGWAMKTNAPVLARDLREDARFHGAAARQGSAIVAPLLVQRKPYGFVCVETDESKAFGADDLRSVDLLAALASMTLENIQLYESVHSMAIHDALTQLFTQRAFRQRLHEELLRSGRSQSPLSLIMCDVDHFKRYNDTYGHQAGDELLRSVARILANHTRPVDCVARYGGEEFALILPNVVRSQAVEIANRIRLAVAAEPFVFHGQRTSVTMSFGVGSFPQDATSDSQIIRAADERLYQSKHNGRNQVTG